MHAYTHFARSIGDKEKSQGELSALVRNVCLRSLVIATATAPPVDWSGIFIYPSVRNSEDDSVSVRYSAIFRSPESCRWTSCSEPIGVRATFSAR
jgi:hypothetical protein